MPARNHTKWKQVPGQLKEGEYVDSRIYSDPEIFKKEIKTIFSKVWVPVCHESEVEGMNSFRTSTIANVPIIVVRYKGEVKAFQNLVERRPRGILEMLPETYPLHCDV